MGIVESLAIVTAVYAVVFLAEAATKRVAGN
jgi:hypothetical protein